MHLREKPRNKSVILALFPLWSHSLEWQAWRLFGEGLGLFRKPSSGGPTQLHTMEIKLSSLWGGCEDLFFLGKLVRHLYFLKKCFDESDKEASGLNVEKHSRAFSTAKLCSQHSLRSLTCGNELSLQINDKTIKGPFGDYGTHAYTVLEHKSPWGRRFYKTFSTWHLLHTFLTSQ